MMFGRGYYYGDGYNGMMGGYGWVAALLMWLFFALVLLGIAALVIWAFRSAARHNGHGYGHGGHGWHGGQYQGGQGYGQQQYSQQVTEGGVITGPDQGQGGQGGYGGQPRRDDEAISIARRRFANGELTREEYEDMMRSLGA